VLLSFYFDFANCRCHLPSTLGACGVGCFTSMSPVLHFSSTLYLQSWTTLHGHYFRLGLGINVASLAQLHLRKGNELFIFEVPTELNLV
jgi:hypothetical protein